MTIIEIWKCSHTYLMHLQVGMVGMFQLQEACCLQKEIQNSCTVMSSSILWNSLTYLCSGWFFTHRAITSAYPGKLSLSVGKIPAPLLPNGKGKLPLMFQGICQLQCHWLFVPSAWDLRQPCSIHEPLHVMKSVKIIIEWSCNGQNLAPSIERATADPNSSPGASQIISWPF